MPLHGLCHGLEFHPSRKVAGLFSLLYVSFLEYLDTLMIIVGEGNGLSLIFEHIPRGDQTFEHASFGAFYHD